MPTTSAAPVTHDLQAERALLGSILVDNSVLTSLNGFHRDEFFSDSHRLIWDSFRRLESAGHAIELVTVDADLIQHGTLEKCGGAGYLASLMDGVPIGSTATVKEYVRIVTEHTRRRKAVARVSQISTRLLEAKIFPKSRPKFASWWNGFGPSSRRKSRKRSPRFWPAMRGPSCRRRPGILWPPFIAMR